MPLAQRAEPYLPLLPVGRLSAAHISELRALLPEGKAVQDTSLTRAVWQALLKRAEFEEHEFHNAGMRLQAMLWRSRREDAIEARQRQQRERREEFLLCQGRAEDKLVEKMEEGSACRACSASTFGQGPRPGGLPRPPTPGGAGPAAAGGPPQPAAPHDAGVIDLSD